MIRLSLGVLVVLSSLVFGVAHAQSADPSVPAAVVATPVATNFNSPIDSNSEEGLTSVVERVNLIKPDVDLNQIPSLFFTPSEQSLVAEARLGLTARAPTGTELRQAEAGNVPIGPRELALGGIVYLSSNDWTIWLNGEKITRNRLPSQIYDIDVKKNYVRLKWFDAYTNQIFPVKLRAHQRFNIDTRIFLPGEASVGALGQ